MLLNDKVKHAKIDDTTFIVNKEITMKRKHETETISLNKEEQIKEQSKKLIKLEKKKCSKQKIMKEVFKIENKLENKKKKKTIVKSTKNFHVAQTEKKNYFNNAKCSDNLMTYFNKVNPKEFEEEKLIKTKVTSKSEIQKFQNLSHSDCNTEKKLFNAEEVLNLKQLHEFDKIDLVDSKTFILTPGHDKLSSCIQQNKHKWSLKIQFQSNNTNKTGIIDDSEVHTPLKLINENRKNCKKIPKILLPIKNKKRNSSLDIYINKSRKEDKEYLKINLEGTCKFENVNEKRNYSSVKKLYGTDFSHLKPPTLQVEYPLINENYLKYRSKVKLTSFTNESKSHSKIVKLDSLVLQSEVFKSDTFNDTQTILPVKLLELPFPKVSHITQLPLENHMFQQTCNFLLRKNENLQKTFELFKIKPILNLNNRVCIPEIVHELVKSNIEATLFEIKSYCSDALSLWKFVSKFTKYKNSQQILKMRYKTTNKQLLKWLNKNDLQNQLVHCLWTDKYKPSCSTDIVGNEEAAEKLKFWLNNWKLLKCDEDCSSSKEFYASNYNKNCAGNNQVAVLIGPHGSGKTASVYAIANELGYKVVEVNASSKRPGKKILKDFEEATKSHRFEKLNLKNIFKSKLKETKKAKEISQKSLILMEDVDIIFEEDDGFISAMFHLATNSKRPIIMTLTNGCSYLYKLAPKQFKINFQPVAGKRLLALLQLIILSETGCKVSQNFLNVLCESGDLRKCLLQLQYLLMFGKERISFTSLAVNNLFWKNMQINIYKSSMTANMESKKNQMYNYKSKKIKNNILNYLVDYLDSFSLISKLFNINDLTLHLIFEPSISLLENPSFFSCLTTLSLEIGSWLNDTINTLFFNELNILIGQISNYQLLVKEQTNNIDIALSQVAAFTLDHEALAVDYISNIRTICRAEKIRNQLNSKRGNRFFHYLQNFRFVISTAKLNIFSTACKTLQKTFTTVTDLN